MPIELTDRQRRLLDAFLLLATIALFFVVMGMIGNVFAAFGDVVLLFFLAWLLSFALLPLINLVARLLPRVPRAASVLVVYAAVVIVAISLIVQLASSLAASIGQFITDAPRLEQQLSLLLAEVERRLAGLGFAVSLVDQAPVIIENLRQFANELAGPLQAVAVASIGILGNVLILLMLSLYIALDRAAILAFLYRLVPPGFATEARLLQVSVAKSFGGFLRGQAIMGVTYGAVAAVANVALGLEYGAVTSVLAGVLHAVPFFGPFLSWMPPVAVALLLRPEAFLPTLVIMGIGWLVTMNALQPRLMADAVGIHPIVVLGSVVIGSKIAGIAGAIFGIPIAAVVSAFFFHFYARSRESGTVTDRATRRVEARAGHEIRRPREPVGGVDEDLDEARRPNRVRPAAPSPPRPPTPEGESGR